MPKQSSLELAKEIGDKIHGINLVAPGWLARGTSANEAQLLVLRKSVALLVEALAKQKTYSEVMERYEALVGAVDVAGITGLIGENELSDYYKLVDELWVIIEKERRINGIWNYGSQKRANFSARW
ncbi:hypothetical protein KC867_01260 [Candidatus Saccharibacteria bacterium]|nr:hypothetical protein [Candidatus Saccharibacteria bacterium]